MIGDEPERPLNAMAAQIQKLTIFYCFICEALWSAFWLL